MTTLKTPESIKQLAKALLNLDSETELTEKQFLDLSVDWNTYPNFAEHLKTDEKSVGIIMNRCTFENRPNIKNVRQKLIENRLIETVIALPDCLLDDTMISVTMIVLSHNNDCIRFVNAEKVFCPLNRTENTLDEECIKTILEACNADGKISCTVQSHDGLDDDLSLCPMYYVKPYVENGVELGELCIKIICGLQLSVDKLNDITSETPTKYQYFQPKNMKYGTIGHDLPYLSEVHETYLNHQIKNHSLVFSKLGSPLKVALAEIPDEKVVIAVGRLYIFELDEERVNPYYVRDYFESEEGQDALRSCSMGIIPNLDLDKIKQIQIPVIPLEDQNKLIEKMVSFI